MKMALHWKIVLGLVLGVALGVALNRWGADVRAWMGDGTADFLVNLNRVVGELFKRSLQFIAVPIILFAMILAVGSLGDIRSLGRIGAKTVGIFLATATASVIVGLVLVNVIRPGGDAFFSADARERLTSSLDASSATKLTTSAKSLSPWDLVRDIVPTNPFDALARGDMLQVVVLALLLGIALAMIPRDVSAPVLAVFRGLSEAFTTIVRGIMHVAPIGVFCLIVPTVATLGLGALSALGAYCVTVLAGLAVIQLIIYPCVVKVFTRMPLWGKGGFFSGLTQVQVVAFSSSSSAATLPVTIAAVRDKLGVPADITGFVCAMGAKINMDGTALMQAIATVFLAQFYGQELTLTQQASIVITAVVAAIGSPGIPSGGMIMLVIVLQTYGINPAGIAMILAVDRVLDMCRTIVNVTGDAAVAVAVAGSEGRLGAVTQPESKA